MISLTLFCDYEGFENPFCSLTEVLYIPVSIEESGMFEPMDVKPL
jgi:hypothetical protein